ncbi:MAG TPA: tetratricopeptide repeat protein, partial [Streptomyces sp.]|nr:tetratricopeptide repeat protein [Streptomyces sp.]
RAAEGAAAARAVLLAADDLYNTARAATLLGRSALARGEHDEAERLLSGALADLGAVGADAETARALFALGAVAEGRGERSLARDRYEQALALAVAANQPGQVDELRERLRLLAGAGPQGGTGAGTGAGPGRGTRAAAEADGVG